jgi:23S rRNA (cytidine2498-2'-O)-methyltransferase
LHGKSHFIYLQIMSDFLFITCQAGAERAVKGEIARLWSDFRLAYSRPGFLTFKLSENRRLAHDFDLHSIFARAYGFSIGKVKGNDASEMARQAWQLFGHRRAERIHVWSRDSSEPGRHGYQPGITPQAMEVHARLLEQCGRQNMLGPKAGDPLHVARRGEIILDCTLVEPDEWWIGFHRAERIESRWPGGMLPLDLPADAVSRAWLKMEEALRWSQLPIPRGARVAEIGSAPGGASQALLAREMIVTGIDPAEMRKEVLNNPHFTHLRRRCLQVPRREFRKIRWITADMNVAPNYTLDAVESIVLHPQVNIRGLILTLKLADWDLADETPGYIERIKSWGYNLVRARQLQHNRCEICVAALQKPFRRKSPHIA